MISQGEILAFLGLLNGMIGGTILILPIIGMQTGYILIPIISCTFGLISYYTCHLIVAHVGQNHNIREVILQHFNNKHSALVIYNLVIGLSLLGFLVNYFQLIIKQIQGFIYPNPWIAVGVFITLLTLTVVMRYFSFGERLLAFGILSIVGYIIFLIWAQATAPSQPKSLPTTGPKFIDLAASLIMGYSIHDFVVQILFKTTTNNNFGRVVKMVYVAGTLIYTFISYAAIAIINREPRQDQPEAIGEYFPHGSWQTRTIEALYLFHLLTATPQFCLIMRQRFLQIFRLQQSPNITIPQFTIYFITYGLGFLLHRLKTKISTIIEINGAVIGFLYVFLIPIIMHIKCVYFNKHDEQGKMVCQETLQNGQTMIIDGKCQCKFQYKNKYTKYGQLALQIGILILGSLTSAYTMHMMFFATQAQGDGDL